MLFAAVVVFLVFGFFWGPKLGIYMYRDASTKRSWRFAPRKHIRIVSFPLLFDIAYVVVDVVLLLVRLYFLDLTSCSRPLT